MLIEHIAMYVDDLEGARQFFETYFKATSNEKYHNQNTQFQSYFLTFDSGARLEIMTRPEHQLEEKSLYRTGYVHVAFSLGSKEAVDALTEELNAAGYEIISGPRTTGDGYYESAMIGFEGNMIELTV
ncbi:VOC family protein [Aerococcaceae bacterium DSM 111176]|nr:VOC family protein [Aerococcaceae bacterium DSM 111176]